MPHAAEIVIGQAGGKTAHGPNLKLRSSDIAIAHPSLEAKLQAKLWLRIKLPLQESNSALEPRCAEGSILSLCCQSNRGMCGLAHACRLQLRSLLMPEVVNQMAALEGQKGKKQAPKSWSVSADMFPCQLSPDTLSQAREVSCKPAQLPK